jgi:UDP-2,3-diacylglucosamine pyrophosphatase LpxH
VISVLVIISDTHLSDGTTGDSIRLEAFRDFRQQLRDIVYDASWRADGSYKPIEEFDLVLLGDFLDIIRSTGWLVEDGGESAVRPWSDWRSQPFLDKVSAINAAVLQNNADSLAVLKSLTDGKTITLPAATREGRPALVHWEPESPNRLPVKVHIHCLVGNHDWFYHLPGASYDRLRQTVIDAIGCENPATSPFPHDPYESDTIRRICEEHGVFARHGDIFDPFNFAGNRDSSSLGDAVVVELVDRFAMVVKAELGGDLPPACIDGLKEIDNLRPTVIIPVWIDDLLHKTCPNAKLQMKVRDIWDRMVDSLIELDFVQTHHSRLHLFDSVSDLEWGLKFSKGLLHADLGSLFAWISTKGVTRETSYSRRAFDEAEFKNRKARFVVYGHTHYYELVPLASTVTGGSILDQIYINSGTWRPYHELARCHPELEQFVGYQVMTYLTFFKNGENQGRSFESWCGSLGPSQRATP